MQMQKQVWFSNRRAKWRRHQRMSNSHSSKYSSLNGSRDSRDESPIDVSRDGSHSRDSFDSNISSDQETEVIDEARETTSGRREGRDHRREDRGSSRHVNNNHRQHQVRREDDDGRRSGSCSPVTSPPSSSPSSLIMNPQHQLLTRSSTKREGTTGNRERGNRSPSLTPPPSSTSSSSVVTPRSPSLNNFIASSHSAFKKIKWTIGLMFNWKRNRIAHGFSSTRNQTEAEFRLFICLNHYLCLFLQTF